MKKKVKKIVFRFSVTAGFIVLLLLIIVLNPAIAYAKKTTYGNYTIFHNNSLSSGVITCVDKATKLIASSEYYDANLKLDICLNDGSWYPGFMKKIRGDAFAGGFYNKVVLFGKSDHQNNFVELNGYRWNLVQLMAHEMIHCFQYHHRGFWRSNPAASIPDWKWEGYPEYIARQEPAQKDLVTNIDRLIQTKKTDNNGWIQFPDGTGTVISYYQYWLLVQYCMDIKKMSYEQLLEDKNAEEAIREEMMKWYSARLN